MKILFAASEVFPFSKTGGLGDVAAALPKALAARGHDVLVVSPLYGNVDTQKHQVWRTQRFIHRAHLWERRYSDRHSVVFLENVELFSRHGIYGDDRGEFGDNARRFAFLSRSLLETADAVGFGPVDVVHLNDWQTGPAALFLARQRGRRPGLLRTIFTIHNMGYQGRFPKRVVEEEGLGWDAFTPEGLEYHDGVNFLKAGLAFSDQLTTVSPTYAREIQTHEHGFGLDGFLRSRADRLTGILNGIDADEWDPRKDPFLAATYDSKDLSGKAACRKALCDELGIRPGERTLLLGVVSRFAQQKGLELLIAALEPLLHRDVALAVLGSGEKRFEHAFEHAARRWPGRVGVRIGYDNKLAHRVEAGADAFLMPSLYEPCGLNQLYSLRYGTVPIVRRTGGLADTVEDHGEPSGGTGFCMGESSVFSLVHAVDRALDAFHDRPRWAGLVQRGMAQDFSWDKSAAAYEDLYGRSRRRG